MTTINSEIISKKTIMSFRGRDVDIPKGDICILKSIDIDTFTINYNHPYLIDVKGHITEYYIYNC